MQLGQKACQMEGRVYVLTRGKSETDAVNQTQVDCAPSIQDSARQVATTAFQALKLHPDPRPSSSQMTTVFDSKCYRYSGEIHFEDGGHLV